MEEPYRKVGRGGAGNFYSKRDIEEVTKSHAHDPEAQRHSPPPLQMDETPTDPSDIPSPPPPPPPTTTDLTANTSSTPLYTRAGRGGAGNFLSPFSANKAFALATPAPATTALPIPTPGSSAAAVTTDRARRPSWGGGGVVVSTGRGGAGNWATRLRAKSESRAQAEHERRRRAVDAKVFDDVKAVLATPRRAYHMQGHHEGKGEEVV